MAVTESSLLRAILTAFFAIVFTFAEPASSAISDDDHAVILLYHHVSEATPASTSVSPAVFESHLEYLEQNNYRVLALAEIVSALFDNQPLPDRSVAITFDDGYQSILSEAAPRIAERNWPFTIFVSTAAIDQGYSGFMSWSDLRQIEAMGGTIANHTSTHDHLVRRIANESASAWQERVTTDIELAQDRLEKELDHPSRMFAWPYGEFNADLEALAAKLGYIAFGQQSGAAGRVSGPHRLPRFPIATAFSDLQSFGEKLQSRPLPVVVPASVGNILSAPARPPHLEMHIPDGPYRLADLRCYVAGQEPAQINIRGNIVKAVAQDSVRPGRSKFNCTAPSSQENGVFYWYSHPWIQPKDDGTWYAE